MTATKHYFVSGIEGLRAIAILIVILNHVGFPFVPGGFVGVDVFFVISGYLITQQLTREARQTRRIDLLEFYARRIRRLFPALFTVVIITLIAGYFVLLPQDIPTTVKSAGAVLFIVSNHWFLSHSRGYFDTTADSLPLLHAWSLSVEEQFYLLWPLLILILIYCERRFSRRLSTVALASVLIASLAACLIQTRLNSDKSFFLMPFRAWEFAMGGLVSGTGAHIRFNSVSARWLINIGLLLLVITAVFLNSPRDFPGWTAVIPCLASALIIVGLTRGEAIPEFTFSVPGCLYRREANSCVMPRNTVEKRRRLFVETLRRVAADFDNVKILDPIDYFCDPQSCKAAISGTSLYRDSNHLSTFGAKYTLQQGASYFRWLLGDSQAHE